MSGKPMVNRLHLPLSVRMQDFILSPGHASLTLYYGICTNNACKVDVYIIIAFECMHMQNLNIEGSGNRRDGSARGCARAPGRENGSRGGWPPDPTTKSCRSRRVREVLGKRRYLVGFVGARKQSRDPRTNIFKLI